jgi:hypothetical protein
MNFTKPLLSAIAISASIHLAATPLHANEALDVLEGKKRSNEVELPNSPGSPSAREEVISLRNEWPAAPLDPLWSRAILFEDAKNPWVQQLAVTGLFQGNATWGEAETAAAKNTSFTGTRVRRSRLGARLKALQNTEIEAVAEFAGEPNHRSIERLQGRTNLPKEFFVRYGKLRPTFTTEYDTEPQRALISENSFLVNMVAPASTLGVVIGRDTGGLDYSMGWFSSDNTMNFPSPEGDGFMMANIAYETTEHPEKGVSTRTRWHADYIHNFDGRSSAVIPRYQLNGSKSANGNQIITNPAYRHLFSTGVQMDQGRFAFAGDFIIAHGDSSAWGFTATPSYWVMPGRIQLVGRYHYAGSDDPGGLVGGMGNSTDPFFDSSPAFIGNEYHSFYLGANFHLYKEELVFMNGVERILLDDETGGGFNADAWIVHTGARLSF